MNEQLRERVRVTIKELSWLLLGHLETVEEHEYSTEEARALKLAASVLIELRN